MHPLPTAILVLLLGSAPALAFDCTALTGTVIPKSAIGLPTSGAVVASASLVGDPRNGTYCKLTGGIKPVDPSAPDIKFQVNLPEHWNGKIIQFGGAGLNGSVVTGVRLFFSPPSQAQPLAQGYVTFGSDSGHKGSGGDASFALNAEALTNFQGAQIKKTLDTAMALVRRVFRRNPQHTYFLGGSEGGREALLAAERWPGAYDGVVSIFPAYNPTALSVAALLDGQAVFGKPGAWVSPAKLSHVSARVLDACDALDGLKDGIIGNVSACRASFDIAALRCVDGADTGAECLSDIQITSLRNLTSPKRLGVALTGVDSFAPWPMVESDVTPGTTIFGSSDDIEKSSSGILGGGITRFITMQDANYDYMHFAPAAHAERLQQLAREMDVTGALAPFARRGGKLLLMAGTSDMTIPPGNTIAYYERLQRAHGAKLAGFARFYMAPGQAHGGGGGNFLSGWDYLGALDAWVAKGEAPGPQIVTDTSKATAGRTRPLCEYPAYPKYKGSGEVDQAASFTCAAP